jgi:hypothetical protein
MVLLLMVLFPIVSILLDFFLLKSSTDMFLLIGKWFVFWAVGIRQLFAGLRQSIQPQFTLEKIFGIKNHESLIIVQELGFANVSMGLLGILSIINNEWILPSAIISGLYFGTAGIRHIIRNDKNSIEIIAMLSDLFLFTILLIFAINRIISNQSV